MSGHLPSLFVALAVGLSTAQEKEPLSPFLDVYEHLAQGSKKYLSGVAAEEAWKPWTASAGDKVLPQLQAEGVAQARPLWLEFDVVFFKEGKGIYNLQTVVFWIGGKAQFGGIRGSSVVASSRAKWVTPLSACTGQAKVFRELAEAVVRVVKAKHGEDGKIPLVDLKEATLEIKKAEILPALVEALHETKETLKEVTSTLASLKYDEIRIWVDDMHFHAVDADGNPKGSLKGEFRIKEKGSVRFEVERYRPLRR